MTASLTSNRHSNGPVVTLKPTIDPTAALTSSVTNLPPYPVAFFYSLPHLHQAVTSLVDALPAPTLHAFAVKAAPFPRLLKLLARLSLGAECASIGEYAISKAAGIPPEKIIYDSPAKTDEHLREVLGDGAWLNADSLEEIHRISDIYKQVGSKSGVGLRVNPQMGTATIQETFTVGASCKFGEAVKERMEGIIEAFVTYPFLTGLHVHVGSQGCKLDLIIDAVRAVVALADEINEAGGNITTIDIGGGISTNYDGDEQISFETYGKRLKQECSGLFKYKIMTELGRRVVAKNAFIAAKVEAVKVSGGIKYAVCHAGADILMRPVYHAHKWHHRVEVFDCNGKRKTGALEKITIAGPMCFSGDLIAKGRDIVTPSVGDWIVIKDTGGYTLGMYSRHTSQLTPAVYGFGAEDPVMRNWAEGLEILDGGFVVIKKMETVEDVVRFWS